MKSPGGSPSRDGGNQMHLIAIIEGLRGICRTAVDHHHDGLPIRWDRQPLEQVLERADRRQIDL